MINKKLFLGIFFILGIIISSSFLFAYTQSYYSSEYNNAMGIGAFPVGGYSLKVDESMCQQGTDFLIQIGPLSCTPTLVRSDLLEEENVNVFCQMTALQINPFVDVKRIDTIRFQNEYPREVVSIGYQPAQSALGYNNGNLEGSLFLQNLGYVVITLRQQPNESALTNCKKATPQLNLGGTTVGSEVCWIEGNLTANLQYDVQNVFGVGQAVFYLPVMEDSEWQNNYVGYSFWGGRGYLRANSVGDGEATLSVYSDNSVARGLLTGQRRYTLAQYSSNILLKDGTTSNKIFLPGLSPCLASLQLKLDGVVNPDTRAVIRINNDYTEVPLYETFLEGKCSVADMTRNGVTSEVKIICSGADTSSDRKPFYLRISPRVNLSINGIKKDYGVGDFLYQEKNKDGSLGDKYVYLGYVGSEPTVGDPSDVNSLYATLIAIPINNKDGEKSKLTESEISSVALYAQTSMASPDTGSKGADKIIGAWNTFKTGAIIIGKATLNGENFVNVPYKETLKKKTAGLTFFGTFSGTESMTFKGVDVSLQGFLNGITEGILPSDNQNYTNAMSDLGTVVNSYPNEVEKQNSIQTLGEQAMYEEIKLADAVGKKETLIDLCNSFRQTYPDTYLNLDICTNALKLASNEVAVKEITVNGITKRISFDGIKEPSRDDYSAELIVQGPNTVMFPYVLEKNKLVVLSGFRSEDEQKKLADIEYVRLGDLSKDSATIRIHVAGKTPLEAFSTEDQVLKKGESKTLGGYIFTLKDVNLKQVAKVEVISNQEFARSNSSFTFKIGVEKRGIQLSPEKAKDKIIAQNKSIADLQKISDALYTTVKTMKAACLATGTVLTLKNFVANMNGKAIARQKVMGGTGDGGWNDVCAKQVGPSPKKYRTLDACFLDNADKIEGDVNSMYGIIQKQNTEIANIEKENGGSVDNKGAINTYSKTVANTLNLPNVDKALGSLTEEQKKNLDVAKVKEILSSSNSYGNYYEKNAYTFEQLRDIELYSSYVNANPNNNEAKNKLISVLSNVYVNSNQYVQAATIASSMGIDSGSIDYMQTNPDTKHFTYKGLTNVNTKINGIDPTTPVAVLQVPPYGTFIYVLDKSVGSPIYTVKDIYKTDGTLLDGETSNKIKNVVFEKYDATSYENKFISSYGSSEPLIRFYEVAPYQGKPAVVPFDLKNGWYAGVQSPQTSYDASGVVRSFWLCNVGQDGIEEFQLDNFGGDICQLINLNTAQTYNAFSGLSQDKIVALTRQAQNAIETVQRARANKEGLTGVSIPNSGSAKAIKVGEPPSQSSGTQCTDFMSPKDCNLLFNLCDPVICPTSRCNLGGNYPVQDVIQTGIIGSIALCYPNAKWNGGDVYVPVCLSGIQAGLDNWIQVKKDYVSCLQKSIDTGETVGICDEIHSIYLCEFFWKQSLPIIKYALPKLLEKITGQSGKGGGEYQGIASALSTSKGSIDYFKQYYAANSYKAFKIRSTEEVGTEACGSFISAIYPDSGSFLDNLITPDSPFQFTGKFDEIQLTTATNPPTSQYKVFFQIYAGRDSGAYYTVYLRGSGSSYYQDTSQNRNVKSSYIPKGGSASETIDFTAPSGYQTLCIVVNGQEECGFKQVSTSFAVNYLKDMYLAEQATVNVTTEEECISGTASFYSLLNLNAESIANNLLDPALYTQGIIRVCATSDPGVGTDVGAGTESARWKKVGTCGQSGVGCWIDTVSVDNAIKAINLKNKALGEITDNEAGYLSSNYLTVAQFNAKMDEINAETSNFKKIEIIMGIIDKVYYNNQKAQLFFQRGKAYAALAIAEYKDILEKLQNPGTNTPGATISDFDKTYSSPAIIFEDGALFTKNICYKYFNAVWHWSGSCTDDSSTQWTEVTKLTDIFGNSPNARNTVFIQSLQGKYYLEGLELLVVRTIADSEGGVSKPDLKTGDSMMLFNGVFNVKIGGVSILYKLADPNWFVSTDGKTWLPSAGYTGYEKELAAAIQGKNMYEGAAILLDPSSTAVRSANTIPPVTTTLAGSLQKRDLTALTNLMNALSNGNSGSSLRCYCGTNCADYAKWITDASGIQVVPDELLLLAIMIQETSCKSVASSGGDYGLMQINAKMHCGTKGLGLISGDCTDSLLNNNELNINIGAQILGEAYSSSSRTFMCGINVKSYSGWEAALRGYNGWGCTGNNNYVENVEAKYYELVNLYNGLGVASGNTACISMEIKCVGTTYYTCVNGAWFSQGLVDGKCGYKSPIGGTNTQEIFIINPTLLQRVFQNTVVDYKYDSIKGWQWTINDPNVNPWMPMTTTTVTGSSIVIPSQNNNVINSLNGKNYADGKKILKDAGAKMLDGSEIVLSSTSTTIAGTACTSGQTKCEGIIYYTCVNNIWTSQGPVEGQCGYTSPVSGTGCSAGQTKCEGTTYYICTNNLWISQGEVDGKCGYVLVCSASATKCEGKIYYTCVNNAWVSQGNVDGKCGYTSSAGIAGTVCSTDGASRCGAAGSVDDQKYFLCQNKVWVSQGFVNGRCGYVSPTGMAGTACTTNGATTCGAGAESKIYLICQNKVWVSQGMVDGRCGYSYCTAGTTKCVGTTYYTCLSNAYINQGTIDGKCGYTSPSGVCTVPQPYAEALVLTNSFDRVLFAASALDGTPALKGSVIGDYDKSGGVNCFDSTIHIYDKAGVNYDCVYSDNVGTAYTSDGTQILTGTTKNNAGSTIFQINPGACDTRGLSETDKLNNIKPGYLLSIVWNPTSGHSVIFINWVNANSHTNARVFDWIGGFSYKTYDISDGKHSVYMYWKPVNK